MSDPALLADRFWPKVEKGESCWLWKGATSNLGYGQINFEGKTRKAHHAAWLLEHGVWPKFICHSCDVRNCVNPAHMREGNQKMNMEDRSNRGRMTWAKLDPDKVRTIRRMYKEGVKSRALAVMFGVHRETIRYCAVGKTWKHVQEVVNG